MGVKFLTSYLLDKCPGGTFPVNLLCLIEENIQSKECENTLVIDGTSLIHCAYSGLDWIHGGQIKQFQERLIRFFDQITSSQCKIVIFLSGSHAAVKHQTWTQRHGRQIKIINDVFKNLSQPSKVCLTSVFLKLVQESVYSNVPNCEVKFSVGPCDQEAAKYARDHNCLALLGEDSDYIIYEGAKYYLSARFLDVQRLTTKAYDRKKFLEVTGLQKDQLPFFAMLMGNEIIPPSEMYAFHQKFKVHGHELLLAVARFIVSNNIKENMSFEELSNVIFNDPSHANKLKQCIEVFTYQHETIIQEQLGPWGEILKLSHDLYNHAEQSPQIFNVMYHRTFFSGNNMENFADRSTQAIANIMRNVRKNIYAILFYEVERTSGRCDVLEFCVTGMYDRKTHKYTIAGVNVPIAMPLVKHPGLKTLWCNNDKKTIDRRWDLFCSAICSNLNVNRVKNLKPHLMIPGVTLFYLYHQSTLLNKNDVLSFIIQAVQVKTIQTRLLEAIEIVETNPRAVQLASQFIYAVWTIDFLNSSCGYPISHDDACLANYFDGKLFHSTYMKCESGHDTEDFNLQSDNKKDYISLRDFIFNSN